MYWETIFYLALEARVSTFYVHVFFVTNTVISISEKMAEITFVNVESETVEVKEECAEEEDPLSATLSTKG